MQAYLASFFFLSFFHSVPRNFIRSTRRLLNPRLANMFVNRVCDISRSLYVYDLPSISTASDYYSHNSFAKIRISLDLRERRSSSHTIDNSPRRVCGSVQAVLWSALEFDENKKKLMLVMYRPLFGKARSGQVSPSRHIVRRSLSYVRNVAPQNCNTSLLLRTGAILQLTAQIFKNIFALIIVIFILARWSAIPPKWAREPP